MSRFSLPALAMLALTLSAFLPADRSAEKFDTDSLNYSSIPRTEVIRVNNSLLIYSL